LEVAGVRAAPATGARSRFYSELFIFFPGCRCSCPAAGLGRCGQAAVSAGEGQQGWKPAAGRESGAMTQASLAEILGGKQELGRGRCENEQPGNGHPKPQGKKIKIK